jgi:hypothetical protein
MNKRRAVVFMVMAAFILLPRAFIFAADPSGYSKRQTAISKALDFLSLDQLAYGEFQTFVSVDPEMQENCRFDSSSTITTFVLYSISFIDDQRVKDMTKKALSFFLEEMEEPGVWRYWTSRNHKKIDPDLDDTACASYELRKNNVPFKSNLEVILANRNNEGLFYTWLIDSPEANDIDCAVNANVLLYLGENENTKAVCNYLNNLVSSGQEGHCSLYYPDVFSFYYMFSRAYFNGVPSLAESRDTIINKIIALQRDDGSFGSVLSTALAACTLLNFKYGGEPLNKAIEYIINTQAEDGSWQKQAFYIGPDRVVVTRTGETLIFKLVPVSIMPMPVLYYGSEELTTAVCIEALSRYQ